MKVKVKRLSSEAVIPFKTHKEDFCFDVTAVTEEEIAHNVWKYGLGLAFQIDRTSFSLSRNTLASLDLRPRSSIWKTGMVLANSTGTIDELYIGEVSAVFYHVMPDMPRYKINDRIGQIKLGTTLKLTFEEIDELDDTVRGSGGFGSTGK